MPLKSGGIILITPPWFRMLRFLPTLVNRNDSIWLGGFLHLEVFARKKTFKVELLGQKGIYILMYYYKYYHIRNMFSKNTSQVIEGMN